MLSREITENFKNRFAFAWPTYCGAIERVRSLTPVCHYALFIASVHNTLERVNCYAIINNITVICTANAELCVSFMSSLHNILLKVNKLLVIYITKGKFCGIWSTATQTTEISIKSTRFCSCQMYSTVEIFCSRFFTLQDSSNVTSKVIS